MPKRTNPQRDIEFSDEKKFTYEFHQWIDIKISMESAWNSITNKMVPIEILSLQLNWLAVQGRCLCILCYFNTI